MAGIKNNNMMTNVQELEKMVIDYSYELNQFDYDSWERHQISEELDILKIKLNEAYLIEIIGPFKV